jgi:hypothetical protein
VSAMAGPKVYPAFDVFVKGDPSKQELGDCKSHLPGCAIEEQLCLVLIC